MSDGRYDVALVGLGVGANYGSVLTYYSLYKTLEGFGNRVLMVSKIDARVDDPEIRETHALNFAREHYNLSKAYGRETVRELNDTAHTFVIGSDQVWNYGISKGFGKAFYLDFAEERKRKLSYAASFGHVKDFAPPEEVPKIAQLIKRFNAASVREDSGVKLAQEVYGISLPQVAEPIFLTDAKHYKTLAARSTRDVSEPYLLAYILDPTPEKKAAIEHLAGKLGLPIRVILDGWPQLFEVNKAKMNLDEAIEAQVDTYDFLKLYANASFVITDSFHGTAFSLKFKKPFAAIGNRRRGVTRFESIFRLVGSGERFTLRAEELIERDTDFLAPLDYKTISSTLDHHVRDSKKWLKKALKLPVRDTIASREGNNRRVAAVQPDPSPVASEAPIRAASKSGATDELRSFEVKAPEFETNNGDAWRTTTGDGVTNIRVASSEFSAQRGNFVWTDLPGDLQPGATYRLLIDWAPRTNSSAVTVHVRESKGGRYRSVGKIALPTGASAFRTDAIRFRMPEGGFSQIMFGALHFTGDNANADVRTITLQELSPGNSAGPANADRPHSRLTDFFTSTSFNLFREREANPLARQIRFGADGTVTHAPYGIAYWAMHDGLLILSSARSENIASFDVSHLWSEVPKNPRIVEVDEAGKTFKYVLRVAKATGKPGSGTKTVLPSDPNMAVPLDTPTRDQIVKNVISDPGVQKLKRMISSAIPDLSVYVGRELKEYTHNKVGGPADILAFPKSIDQMQKLINIALRNGVAYTILGRGSNVLVRDGGIRGVVIVTTGLDYFKLENGLFTAGAGASFIEASYFLLEHGRSALEWASGIPGTVGGAVFMNAGTYRSDVRSNISSVKYVDENGKIKELRKDEISWGVRYTTFQDHPGWTVLEATFRTAPADKALLSEKMLGTVQARENSFPLESPNHGSTFKWYRAPRLIEQAGLTGYRIGGVQISTKQPGFFVNVGQATASDYEALINYTIARVYEYSGFLMEPEVEIIGERPHRYKRYTDDAIVGRAKRKLG